MRIKLAACVLLASSACSGPFTSAFQGTILTRATSCSAGLTFPNTETFTAFYFEQHGDTATWSGVCNGDQTAHVHGNVATADPYTCPGASSSGLTVTGGTMTVEGDVLTVNLQAIYTLVGSPQTCNLVIEGALRQAN